MGKSFWPTLLVINSLTWEDRQNIKFSMMLVLKAASLLGSVVVFFKLLAAALRSENFATLPIIQVVVFLTLLTIHLACRNYNSIRWGGMVLLSALSAALILTMLTSTNALLLGSYHFVTGLFLAGGFLLGIRYVLGLFALFSAVYLGFMLDVWDKLGWSTQEPISQPLVTLYIDRILELAIVTLFVVLYHRLKERQYNIIAEHERAHGRREKLLSINRMAGGIAHEINNPLAIVMGYVEILANQESYKPIDRRVLGRVSHACERISSIVRSILELSKDGDGSLEAIDLVQSCQFHAELMSQRPSLAHIKCKIQLAEKSFQIPNGHWDLITKALIQNGFEAASNQPLPEVRISSEENTSFFLLTIADNGPLFDEAQIPNFFEPFYSSKADFQGRGMGLTIAYVLATRLGWNIDISRAGAWTQVRLKIPITSLQTQQRAG